MIPLTWLLLEMSLWARGSGQILQQDRIKVLYPKLDQGETVECDCADFSCDAVFWFRVVLKADRVEYIGKCTYGERVRHGDVDRNKFQLSKKASKTFQLRISPLSAGDAGIYSCVLTNASNYEMWRPATLLLPGATPPTEAPVMKPRPPVTPVCPCSGSQQQGGCASLLLWPLVGLLSALALVLLCVLYYFSRLPKKCRHHFVKTRPKS